MFQGKISLPKAFSKPTVLKRPTTMHWKCNPWHGLGLPQHYISPCPHNENMQCSSQLHLCYIPLGFLKRQTGWSIRLSRSQEREMRYSRSQHAGHWKDLAEYQMWPSGQGLPGPALNQYVCKEKHLSNQHRSVKHKTHGPNTTLQAIYLALL